MPDTHQDPSQNPQVSGTPTNLFIEVNGEKTEVLKGSRGGYFYISSEGKRSALSSRQRESIGLPVAPAEGSGVHKGTPTGKYIEIGEEKEQREVFKGIRGGYFFINANGNRSSLRPAQREKLGLPVTQKPEAEKGESIGKFVEVGKEKEKKEVFKSVAGDYYFINNRNRHSKLKDAQLKELGLEVPPKNGGDHKGTPTGLTIEVGAEKEKREVFKGPRGGYFFINANGNRSSLRPAQREKLGLPVTQKPEAEKGESIGKFVEVGKEKEKKEVFKSVAGDYYFINLKGRHVSLTPMQREELGLEPGKPRKAPNGTPTGMFVEVGKEKEKKEVMKGPQGGYFFINSAGGRSSLRPAQREALGLNKKE